MCGANWSVSPLETSEAYSSWFADRSSFPKGSVDFDCALVMRNISHYWFGQDDLYVEAPPSESVASA